MDDAPHDLRMCALVLQLILIFVVFFVVSSCVSSGAWSTAYGSLEPVSASWKAADPEQWQLSSHNTKPGVDMGCIRGVEERLGPWRMTRQMENEIENTYDQPDQELN